MPRGASRAGRGEEGGGGGGGSLWGALGKKGDDDGGGMFGKLAGFAKNVANEMENVANEVAHELNLGDGDDGDKGGGKGGRPAADGGDRRERRDDRRRVQDKLKDAAKRNQRDRRDERGGRSRERGGGERGGAGPSTDTDQEPALTPGFFGGGGALAGFVGAALGSSDEAPAGQMTPRGADRWGKPRATALLSARRGERRDRDRRGDRRDRDRREERGGRSRERGGGERTRSPPPAAPAQPPQPPPPVAQPPRATAGAAADVHAVLAAVRAHEGAALDLKAAHESFALLGDASQALVLASLQARPDMTALRLRGCHAGEQSALALAQLVGPGAPCQLRMLDVRGSLLGERGVFSLCSAMHGGCSLAELRIDEASGPLPPASIEALATAARRASSLRRLRIGGVESGAGGGGGALARLQLALLANHEQETAADAADDAAAAADDAADDDDEKLDDVLGATIRRLRPAAGGPRPPATLRLAHDAAAAAAPLPRQLALLRCLRDCAGLRSVSLVNVGLGDAWGLQLARALPQLASLRLLDVTHNLLGAASLEALGGGLDLNDSLLHVAALPQWLPPPQPTQDGWRAVLARRRLKLELTIVRARGLVSARDGTGGEPRVAFEWDGKKMQTAAARDGSFEARWNETFTLCVPASVLIRQPPEVGGLAGNAPLRLTVLDDRPKRSIFAGADPPLGSCEVPLACLLRHDSASVSCALAATPADASGGGGMGFHLMDFSLATASGGDAPLGGAGELEVRLRLLHCGDAQPDDATNAGVPRQLQNNRAQQGQQRRKSVTALQANWRARDARDKTAAKRRERDERLTQEAREAQEREEQLAHEARVAEISRKALYRIQNASLIAGWTTWHSMWEETVQQREEAAAAAAALAAEAAAADATAAAVEAAVAARLAAAKGPPSSSDEEVVVHVGARSSPGKAGRRGNLLHEWFGFLHGAKRGGEGKQPLLPTRAPRSDEELFAEFDANGDGKISRKEFMRGMARADARGFASTRSRAVRRFHAYMLALALVVCFGLGSLLFYVTSSPLCHEAGSSAERCLAIAFGFIAP